LRLRAAPRSPTVEAVPTLIAPAERLADSFAEAVGEFIAEGRGAPDDNTLLGELIRRSGPPTAPEAWIAQVLEFERALRERPNPRFVPSTTHWWAEDATFLGRINIRHRLNEHLRDVGGHIGYDVRPAARLRGHATAMLAAALPVAAALGIEKALVTCDADNVGSRKAIERNGGVFEDRRGDKLRYWVPTGTG
jgi:predicted acetyltransferase